MGIEELKNRGAAGYGRGKIPLEFYCSGFCSPLSLPRLFLLKYCPLQSRLTTHHCHEGPTYLVLGCGSRDERRGPASGAAALSCAERGTVLPPSSGVPPSVLLTPPPEKRLLVPKQAPAEIIAEELQDLPKLPANVEAQTTGRGLEAPPMHPSCLRGVGGPAGELVGLPGPVVEWRRCVMLAQLSRAERCGRRDELLKTPATETCRRQPQFSPQPEMDQKT